MGRKRDKRIIVDAANRWLDELEGEIVPNVLTKEERKSYSKQARALRGALERHSWPRQDKGAAATGSSAEQPADPQSQANLQRALDRSPFMAEPL